MSSSPVVGAVIVAFNPDIAQVLRLVGILASQVSHTVLVDNTEGGSPLALLSLPATIELLALGRNTGIAGGFNAGIRHMAQYGCDYIFLSDQDSIPADNIISELCAAHGELLLAGQKVGVVGPAFVDPRDGRIEGFPVFGWNGQHFHSEPDDTGNVPASFLISSGSLIPRAVIDEVGLMDAGLFIDLVDIEWCYRALAKGFTAYGVPSARMEHTIGDALVEVVSLGFRVRQRRVHAPFRVYFQVRNVFILCWMRHVPLYWKLWSLIGVVGKIYTYLVQIKSPKIQYWRSLWRGVWHGIAVKKTDRQ